MGIWGPRRVAGASLVLAAVATLGLAGCDGAPDGTPGSAGTATSPTSSATSAPTTAPTSAAPTTGSPPATVTPGPPAWLGTRVLPRTDDGFGEVRPTPPELRRRAFTLPDTVPALPGDGFASAISAPAPSSVIARSTWRTGCPVAPRDLAWVRLTFWGFDDQRHTGELLVASSVARDVVRAFRDLYAARFPIEQMTIATRADLDAPPTGDGNGTGAFACRPVRGQTTFSEHAYGLAVDINPFQHPSDRGEVVLPELASSYLDRQDVRPGMITPDGPVVKAFARIGWGWGGLWRSLKDYQHLSARNR